MNKLNLNIIYWVKFSIYWNRGSEKEGKKEGNLKRLKNIEDKNEKQLKMIESKESKQLGIKSVINVFGDEFSQEA